MVMPNNKFLNSGKLLLYLQQFNITNINNICIILLNLFFCFFLLIHPALHWRLYL